MPHLAIRHAGRHGEKGVMDNEDAKTLLQLMLANGVKTDTENQQGAEKIVGEPHHLLDRPLTTPVLHKALAPVEVIGYTKGWTRMNVAKFIAVELVNMDLVEVCKESNEILYNSLRTIHVIYAEYESDAARVLANRGAPY